MCFIDGDGFLSVVMFNTGPSIFSIIITYMTFANLNLFFTYLTSTKNGFHDCSRSSVVEFTFCSNVYKMRTWSCLKVLALYIYSSKCILNYVRNLLFVLDSTDSRWRRNALVTRYLPASPIDIRINYAPNDSRSLGSRTSTTCSLYSFQATSCKKFSNTFP